LVVVETPDTVLVADRSRSQDVKHIVNALQQQKREEHTLHRKVHALGAGTIASTKVPASRSSASRSSPVLASVYKSITTGPSTGSS
jgi:hypothetical protein